jgi:phosphohistidine phosphatase
MELYLIRHGDAVPQHAPGIKNDADRTLTEEGKKELKRIAAGLAKVAEPPQIILTSPLIRARQTAEIVCQAFNLPGHVLQEDGRLSAGASPQNILELLQTLTQERVALVGHEPDFSRFISWLICGQARGNVAMKKGGVARIDFAGDQSELVWLLPPRITRALDR